LLLPLCSTKRLTNPPDECVRIASFRAGCLVSGCAT
jgi:hypothetical protein